MENVEVIKCYIIELLFNIRVCKVVYEFLFLIYKNKINGEMGFLFL